MSQHRSTPREGLVKTALTSKDGLVSGKSSKGSSPGSSLGSSLRSSLDEHSFPYPFHIYPNPNLRTANDPSHHTKSKKEGNTRETSPVRSDADQFEDIPFLEPEAMKRLKAASQKGSASLWTPFALRNYSFFVFVTLFVLLLLSLEALYQVDGRRYGLSAATSRERYLWSYGPTAGNFFFVLSLLLLVLTWYQFL